MNLLAGSLVDYRGEIDSTSKQKQAYCRLGILLGSQLEIYLINSLILVLTIAPQLHCIHTELFGYVHWVGTIGLRLTF